MPVTETIVMIAAFSALTLGFINILRLIGLGITHRTIRKAAEKDPSSVQPLLTALAAPREAQGDHRLSVILVAVGIAILLSSLIIGDPDIVHYGSAAAVFPLVIGTALWLRLYFVERAARRAGQQ